MSERYEAIKQLMEVVIGTSEIPTFSSDTAYAVGEICIYNDTMFRFTNAHQGAWNIAHVVATNFYKEFVRYYSGTSETEDVTVQLTFDGDAPDFTGSYITVGINNENTDYGVDDNGEATFSVAKYTNYTVTPNSYDGYKTPAQRTYTSYIDKRTITMIYLSSASAATEEIVTLEATFVKGTDKPQGDVTITDTTASTTETLTLDANGKCTFIIPHGHEYTITMPALEGYIPIVGKTFKASLANRKVQSTYIPIVSGMMYMDENLNTYSFEDWVASGKSGTEAKYILCTSETLSANGANFFINIDDIRNSAYTTKKWLSALVLVTTMPTNGGADDFGAIPYDPTVPGSGPISNQEAIQAWIDNQAAEGNTYTSDALTYLKTKALTINGVEYPPILGTSGQWKYLSKNKGNYSMLKAMISELSKTDSTLPNDILWDTKNFWTSTQYSAANAWHLHSGSLDDATYNYGKANTYIVFPFYAL